MFEEIIEFIRLTIFSTEVNIADKDGSVSLHIKYLPIDLNRDITVLLQLRIVLLLP